MVSVDRKPGPINNARLVVRSIAAAALSPNIPGTHVEQYYARVNQEEATLFNPSEEEITRGLTEQVHLGRNYSRDELLTLPWSSRRVKPSRLTSAIASFTNAQGKKVATEYMPTDAIIDYLHAVKNKSEETGKPLTVVDQFAVAMAQTDNNPVAAAVLTHAAYRSIARVHDTKVSERLNFPVQASESEISMMAIASSTADFKRSGERDQLGDTYHFWAQFAGNMLFELLSQRYPMQVATYKGLFLIAPEATKFLREDLLRKPQLAGSHKEVNNMSFRIGSTVGRELQRQLKEATSDRRRFAQIPQ